MRGISVKFSAVMVILAALFVMFGSAACGGGGGGTSGSTDGNTDGNTDGSSGVTNVQIIGVSGNSGVGLTNLTSGSSVQLEFVGVDSTYHQIVSAGSNWSTTAPSSQATISSSGVLTIVGTSGTFSVTGTGPNGAMSATVTIQPTAGATVTGLVRNINSLGIAAVDVKFYTASGALLATSTTGPNGTFRATVPTSAAGFTIDVTRADADNNSIYYRQYSYNSFDYISGTDCLATLPTLASGTTLTLPSPIVVAARASGPPPPPTGCLSG